MGEVIGQKSLEDIFNDFLENKRIFLNKSALTQKYTPDNLPHREDEIRQLATMLAPSLRLEKPSNILLFGKSGTGKTLTVKHVLDMLKKKAEEHNISLKFVYINCKMKKVADTEYRLIAQLAREFGKDVPTTGLPTDDIYTMFYQAIDSEKQIVVLVLDEIDHLVAKVGDEIMYNLTRINSLLKNAEVTFIGISNDLTFTERLDARVKSSLGEEELIFSPYDALQLKDILLDRAKCSFYEGVIGESVIARCAAYAAREHGDARRALDLLRISGEIAEREASSNILEAHVDKADERIEKDRIIEAVNKQPKQSQVLLYSVISHFYDNKGESASTGDIFSIYSRLCGDLGLKPLTQRRISDLISELDMLGIIHAKVISQGRYGRTREISVLLASDTINRVWLLLKNDLGL